jgi:hypothetical protein
MRLLPNQGQIVIIPNDKKYGIRTFVQMDTAAAISRKMAEAEKPNMLEDISNSFLFKSTRFCGVCLMSFKPEAILEDVPSEANY